MLFGLREDFVGEEGTAERHEQAAASTQIPFNWHSFKQQNINKFKDIHE